MNCLLILAMICHPAQHKAQLALTAVQAGMLIWDGATTAEWVRRYPQGREMDPLSRVFIGRRPTWERMAPAGAALVVSTALLADRMRHNESRTVRDLWWAPQATTIAGNTWGISVSLRWER